MNRNNHTGVPQTLLSAGRDFFAWGVLWLLSTSLFALPAVVVVLLLAPEITGYLLIGIILQSIVALGRMFSDAGEDNVELNFDPSNRTRSEIILYISVAYVIAASAVATVLLIGSLVAGGFGYILDQPLLAIAIAALFPILDVKMSRSLPFLSVGRTVSLLIGRIIQLIIRLYGFHTSVVNDSVEQDGFIY